MDDLEELRRLLDEPPPPPGARRRLLHELRALSEDSKPRHFGTRTKVVGSVATILVAAVAALFILQGGQAEAWTPTPVNPPDPALVAAASSECGEGELDFGSPLLVDQRGDVAVALFGDRSARDAEAFLTCTLHFSEDAWRRVDHSDLSFSLHSISGSFDEEALNTPVERVVIDTPDQVVDVSHRDGFYLIWWPGEEALDGETMRFLAQDGSTLLETPIRVRQDG